MNTAQAQTEFLKRCLRKPHYPFEKNGELNVPSSKELWFEFFSRLNFLKDRRNWINFTSYFVPVFLEILVVVYLFNYFTWASFWIGCAYGMVFLPTMGTVYFHRFGTHHAFKFRNRFWSFVCANLMVKIVLEEIYIVSHHLHHLIPDQPGDPYNPKAGWLFSFLADVNHQPIAHDISESDYIRLKNLLAHTGMYVNTYKQYKTWGTIAHPFWTILGMVVNWIFWFGVFYWLGRGPELPMAIFAWSSAWAWGIRSWNYGGHAGGKIKHKDGLDFYREDLSINDYWTGWVAGEWHNNHHMLPKGIRAGFLKYQPDTAYMVIKIFIKLGLVKYFRDDTELFHAQIATQSRQVVRA